MASGVDSREKKTADMAYTTEKFFADIDAKNYTMSSVGLITSLSSASNARTITEYLVRKSFALLSIFCNFAA